MDRRAKPAVERLGDSDRLAEQPVDAQGALQCVIAQARFEHGQLQRGGEEQLLEVIVDRTSQLFALVLLGFEGSRDGCRD